MNENPYFYIQKQVQFGNHLVEIDLRILKCRETDDRSSPRNFSWFQDPHKEEFMEYLNKILQNQIQNLLLTSTLESKTKHEILTGKTIHLAYCICDSGRTQTTVLQTVINTEEISFKKLAYLSKKLIFAVCQLSSAARTDAATNRALKVSPYFTAPSCKSAKLKSDITPAPPPSWSAAKPEADCLASDSPEVTTALVECAAAEPSSEALWETEDALSESVATPKERRALRKIVRQGTDKQRSTLDAKKGNRARRHGHKVQGDVEISVIGERKFTAHNEIHRSNITTARTRSSLTSAKTKVAPRLKDLSLEDLDELFAQHQSFLLNIYRNREHCRRHEDFHQGIRTRLELDYQVNLGCFDDQQVNHVVNSIKKMFAPNELKMLDYILKVLLPELLTKIVMQKLEVTYQEAEKEMMNCSMENIEETALFL